MTGMLQLFSCDVYCLLYPGSTISYVTPFLAICIDFDPEIILDPFFISTLLGDSIIAKRVYRECGTYWWQIGLGGSV